MLARDNSQSPPPRALPPLSALRQGSSVKPQASAGSAASFATAASADDDEECNAALGRDSNSTQVTGAAPVQLAAGDASAYVPSLSEGQANGAASAVEIRGAASQLLDVAQQNGAGPVVAHVGATADDSAATEAEPAADTGSATGVLTTPQQPDSVDRAACSRAPGDDSAAAGADVTVHAHQPADAAVPSSGLPQEHTDPLRATALADGAAAGPLQQPSLERPEEPGPRDAERMAGLSLDNGTPLQLSSHSPAAAEVSGTQKPDAASLGADAHSEASAGEAEPRAGQQRGTEPPRVASRGHAAGLAPGPAQQPAAEPSGEASGGHAAEHTPGAGHQRGAEAPGDASRGHAAEHAPGVLGFRGAEASGELPVSTLRMGRCFSGYMSAEEDLPDEEGAMQLPGPPDSDTGAPQTTPDSAAALTHPTASEPVQQGGTGESLPGSLSAWTAGGAAEGAAAEAGDEELQDLSLSAIRLAAAEGSSSDAEEAAFPSGSQAPKGGRELHAWGQGDDNAQSVRGAIPGQELAAGGGTCSSSPTLDNESEYEVAAPSDDTSQSGATEGEQNADQGLFLPTFTNVASCGDAQLVQTGTSCCAA